MAGLMLYLSWLYFIFAEKMDSVHTSESYVGLLLDDRTTHTPEDWTKRNTPRHSHSWCIGYVIAIPCTIVCIMIIIWMGQMHLELQHVRGEVRTLQYDMSKLEDMLDILTSDEEEVLEIYENPEDITSITLDDDDDLSTLSENSFSIDSPSLLDTLPSRVRRNAGLVGSGDDDTSNSRGGRKNEDRRNRKERAGDGARQRVKKKGKKKRKNNKPRDKVFEVQAVHMHPMEYGNDTLQTVINDGE